MAGLLAAAGLIMMTPEGEARTGPNRLAREKSPYLLQHANNPVDWRAWNPETLALARKERKPIFLSIGYSTCHWCHVMEHESFEDAAIAEAVNAHFIPVKVDREERPDVDALYMGYVQSATGRGGWPMTVFLTPELKPFFGGTYFPPADFQELLDQIATLWKTDRAKIEAAATQAGEFLQQLGRTRLTRTGSGTPESLLHEGYHSYAAIFDRELGGFGGPPKFPRPAVFAFLLRYHARFGTAEARDMVLHTLQAMARGGMHDHLGGGFHRYSVDERWHVPHFEKMLYDQAQLATAYLEAFQLTGDRDAAATARDILDYVRRDMSGPGGGFFAAEDADSLPESTATVRREGAFYAFTHAEVERLLGDNAALFCAAYGIEPEGNAFRSDPHGELRGTNVLYVAATTAALSARFNVPATEITARLAAGRATLFAARAGRPRPRLDDKIITSWNGLMISAFARAASPLHDPACLTAATRSADFVLTHLRATGTGALRRRWRDGEAAVPAFLDDYAFLIQGLLDLYEADGGVRWLQEALHLQEAQDTLFLDPAGGYFVTDGKDPSVLARLKEEYDGAEPAGNSVALANLQRLAAMTGRKALLDRAELQARWAGDGLHGQAHAQPQMLASLLFRGRTNPQVVLAGDPGSVEVQRLRDAVRAGFHPDVVMLYADGGAGQRLLVEGHPYIQPMAPRGGKALAYVCRDGTCDLPTDDPAALTKALK